MSLSVAVLSCPCHARAIRRVRGVGFLVSVSARWARSARMFVRERAFSLSQEQIARDFEFAVCSGLSANLFFLLSHRHFLFNVTQACALVHTQVTSFEILVLACHLDVL